MHKYGWKSHIRLAFLCTCLLSYAYACRLTQDPTCAKVSASGHLEKVDAAELGKAEELLFQRHPAMRDWPPGHAFNVYVPPSPSRFTA
jgi:Pyridoxamine 5'-phosphate oxidase